MYILSDIFLRNNIIDLLLKYNIDIDYKDDAYFSLLYYVAGIK